jgi:thioredoxin 1
MIEVNSENFEKEVVHSSQPVMVDFWGPQCIPCLSLMPQVEALGEKYKGQVKLVKVEAPRNRRLCLNLRVMGLPTFLFFKDGKEVKRLTGSILITSIEESLKKFMAAGE